MVDDAGKEEEADSAIAPIWLGMTSIVTLRLSMFLAIRSMITLSHSLPNLGRGALQCSSSHGLAFETKQLFVSLMAWRCLRLLAFPFAFSLLTFSGVIIAHGLRQKHRTRSFLFCYIREKV